MTTVVIDSNLVIKWFVPETEIDLARAIQDRMVDNGWILLAPSLLLLETANILWKKRADFSEDASLNIVHAVRSSGIEFVPIENLVSSAYHLARRFDRTTYDAMYLALAIERNCDFITADERLFNAISSQEPRVKLLRNYTLQ